MGKLWLSANQLLEDSWRLALKVYDSGYRPTVIAGLWRGGCPVAIAVHELLHVLGVASEHYPVKTALYTGLDRRAARVQVSGLELFAAQLTEADQVLLVDDVHDTGLSLAAAVQQLQSLCGERGAEIRTATPYFKPARNQAGSVPDYYVHETDAWIVFPHELEGLDTDELLAHKPGLEWLRARLSRG